MDQAVILFAVLAVAHSFAIKLYFEHPTLLIFFSPHIVPVVGVFLLTVVKTLLLAYF